MLLFAHMLRSCWCLQTKLPLQNIRIFFHPPRQEFSGGDASVLRSSALKGLNCLKCDKIRDPFKNMLAHVFVKLRKTLLTFLGGLFLLCV